MSCVESHFAGDEAQVKQIYLPINGMNDSSTDQEAQAST